MKEQVLSHLGTACTIAFGQLALRLENGSAPAAQNLELHPEIGKVSQKFCPFEPVNDRSYIFTFGGSQRLKIEKYLAFGRIPKSMPNVEIFLNVLLFLIHF